MSDRYWQQPLQWNRDAERAGERRRVFCASMADVLEQHPVKAINDRMDAYRERLWALVDQTPMLDWLFLTKRIEEAFTTFPWMDDDEPMPNAWLGVTAEDDEHARTRIPQLLQLRDHFDKLFVSYEPALGPIAWDRSLLEGLDWVIFGDESGHPRRDAALDWARSTRDACASYGVEFFFKQWAGADAPGLAGERGPRKVIHLPILDGRQHEAYP